MYNIFSYYQIIINYLKIIEEYITNDLNNAIIYEYILYYDDKLHY